MNMPADNAGMGRRQFLKSAALAPLALSMSGLPLAKASARPRARSVVLVWLHGGPSQLDTFDPKPLAPDTHRSPFQTIQTRTTGAHFTELSQGSRTGAIVSPSCALRLQTTSATMWGCSRE